MRESDICEQAYKCMEIHDCSETWFINRNSDKRIFGMPVKVPGESNRLACPLIWGIR